MTAAAITFAALIQREYIAKGLCKLDAFSRIHAQHKVAFSSLRAAFAGLRVQPETARVLRVWAAVAHHVDIDELAMVSAPTAPPRKVARDGTVTG